MLLTYKKKPKLAWGFHTLHRRAQDFVDKLDRARLDDFAVAREQLIYAYMIRMVDDSKKLFVAISNQNSLEYKTILGDASYDVDLAKRALTEFRLWLIKTKSGSLSYAFRIPVESKYSRCLDLIYEHGYAIEYFKAGVWDIDFIDKCIDSGVSPNDAYGLSDLFESHRI